MGMFYCFCFSFFDTLEYQEAFVIVGEGEKSVGGSSFILNSTLSNTQ